MEEISTLKRLIEKLDQCNQRKDYIQLANTLTLGEDELKEYAFWDKHHYTRNCIKRTEDYELLLLCWEKGQETPIHSHNGEECWVHLAAGQLYEQRFEEDENHLPFRVDEQKMNNADLSYMNDKMGYHKLINIADGRSMTLHLYVQPIDQCYIFNEEEQKFILKDLSYHSYNKELNQNTAIEN